MSDNNPSDKKSGSAHLPYDSNQLIKGVEPISLFKKDKKFVFTHQKIEKIIAAVYMITNFFPNDEPAKWSLRKLGTRLLHLNIDLKGEVESNTQIVYNRMRETSLLIVSLLEIASFAGLVSGMNLAVLKKEFYDLLLFVGSMKREMEGGGLRINESFFSNNELGETSDNHTKNREMQKSFKKDSDNLIKDSGHVLYGVEDSVGGFDVDKTQKLKDFSTVAVKKNRRQSVIVSLLKRKKEIMVRDVSQIINDCSEKTIQRELHSLVNQGIIKREGERRWSRYSLV